MKDKNTRILNISIDIPIKDDILYFVSSKEVFRNVLIRKIKMLFPNLKFKIYLQTKEK
jgi:hypothetical protein